MPEELSDLPPQQRQIRLTALPVADAARLLERAGANVIADEKLRADLAAGAPVNEDGTINLVHYTAWLVRNRNNGD